MTWQPQPEPYAPGPGAPAAPGSAYPKREGIPLGRYRDWRTGAIGPRLDYVGRGEAVTLFGPMGSGKDTSVLSLLGLQNTASQLTIDVKGEQAAICVPFRKRLGPVAVINPWNLLVDTDPYFDPRRREWVNYNDLRSCKWNPLSGIDGSPNNPRLTAECGYIADVLIEQATGNNSFFTESANALVTIAITQEVSDAWAERRPPSMKRVRGLICLPSGFDPASKLFFGWPALARQLVQSSNRTLANLAAQFTEWNKEKAAIISDAQRQTKTLDDYEIASDMEGFGVDLSMLKRQVGSVYVAIPPLMVERHSRYLRMLITATMRAIIRNRLPGEPPVILVLNEAYAIGRIELLRSMWSLLRGYGVQVVSCWQSKTQMDEIWGSNTTNTMLAAAGVVASFRAADMTTAEWLSKRCGDTTAVLAGYNQGQSQHGHGAGQSTGLTWTQAKVPAVTPHQLLGLGQAEMVQFAAGLSNFVSAYAPPYWDIDQAAARARRNPFAPQS